MPQLPDIKLFNKGMNKDTDPRFLGQGEYVDALNIMTSNYLDGATGSLTNFPSIQRLSTLGYTILGLFKDEHEDKLYVFASNGTTGRIYTYTTETDTLTTVLSTTELPWDTDTIIKAANITDKIIIWTDGENEIGMYDQNITYGTITSDMLTLAQVAPLEEPGITMVADTAYRTNNIVGKYLQFKYRFVFKNKMRSTFSPISNVAYSGNDYDAPYAMAGIETSVNAIDIVMSGDNSNGLVEHIEIAARSGNNADFFMIKKLEADGTFLAGGTQTWRFYNDGLYEPLEIQESNQLFDDCPREAKTLEFAENRVIVGDSVNGYDKVDVDYDIEVLYGDQIDPSTNSYESDDAGLLADATYIAAGGGAVTPRSVLNSASMLQAFFAYFGYSSLNTGDIISITGKEIPNPSGYSPDPEHPFGYLSIQITPFETWTTLYNRFMDVDFYSAEYGGYLDFMDLGLIPPDPPVGNDKFTITLKQGGHEKTFKSGSWYNIGLQYYDKYGRTNGVQIQDESRAYIKAICERGLTPGSYAGAGAATIKVTINNAMPSWAETVKVVYSRASTYDQSIQVATRGASVVGSVWIDIGSIQEWNEAHGGNLAYQWEKGDKIRVVSWSSITNPLTEWPDSLQEAEIVDAGAEHAYETGYYAIAVPPFESQVDAAATASALSNAIIEIFRPSKTLDAAQSIYTEANFIEGSSDTIAGDAYLKSRIDWPHGYDVPPLAESNIVFESYDISDFNDSEHYDKGRSTAIVNQEETRRFATLSYSEVIIPNTEINELNRFYPDVNYEEYNKAFGAIKHLHSEGDHLLMLQEDKASKVFVDRSLMYDGQGNATVLNTQTRVLSESVPYAGVYGIQDHRSFQAIGNRRYWVDLARGVVVRLSNNGIEEISRYGMRGWFSDMCRTRMEAGETTAYGAYDIQNDLYMLYFGTGNTVVFDEKNNAWSTFTDIVIPAFATYMNNRTFIIYTNYLWELNYDGVKNTQRVSGGETAKTSTIKFVSNVEPTVLKNYLALHLDSTHAMDVSISTDAIGGGTAQLSTLLTTDFAQREQEFHASFLRDANTPNVTYPLISGDTMKGKHAEIELTLQTNEDLLIRMAKVLVSKG